MKDKIEIAIDHSLRFYSLIPDSLVLIDWGGFMGRMCERCEGDIKLSYLLKQNSLDNIICPNCGRALKVTGTSKAVTLASYVSMLSLIIIFPMLINYKIIISGVWTVASKWLLQPLLYTYEENVE